MISTAGPPPFTTPVSCAPNDVPGLRGSHRITGAAPPKSKFYKNGAFDIPVETQFSGGIPIPAPMWSGPLKTGASQKVSRYCSPEFDKPVA